MAQVLKKCPLCHDNITRDSGDGALVCFKCLAWLQVRLTPSGMGCCEPKKSPEITEFMGHPVAYWEELERVVQEYGVANLPDRIVVLRLALAASEQQYKSAIRHHDKDLEELNSLREQHRWIPCSERLPDIGQPVLSFTPNCEEWMRGGRMQLDTRRDRIPAWDSQIGSGSGNAPTHWMPLPEPPKE
jgi:hypothetical protein